MIEESVVDPNAKIATGLPRKRDASGNFCHEVLSPEEIKNLVGFLSESTGGEGAASKGGAAPTKKSGGSKSGAPAPRRQAADALHSRPTPCRR